MSWLKFAAVALCVWGTTSYAALTDAIGGERQELQSISSWTAHLNFYFPTSQVEIDLADLGDQAARQATLEELGVLEQVLRGEVAPQEGLLIHIACANIVCGGENGKCVNCSSKD